VVFAGVGVAVLFPCSLSWQNSMKHVRQEQDAQQAACAKSLFLFLTQPQMKTS